MSQGRRCLLRIILQQISVDSVDRSWKYVPRSQSPLADFWLVKTVKELPDTKKRSVHMVVEAGQP